jgi:hypothetical protein
MRVDSALLAKQFLAMAARIMPRVDVREKFISISVNVDKTG